MMDPALLNLENPERISNSGISDLWFNYDHSAYVPTPEEEYDGTREYDFAAMLDSADAFRDMLIAAGLENVPNAYDLVEDYFARS